MYSTQIEQQQHPNITRLCGFFAPGCSTSYPCPSFPSSLFSNNSPSICPFLIIYFKKKFGKTCLIIEVTEQNLVMYLVKKDVVCLNPQNI